MLLLLVWTNVKPTLVAFLETRKAERLEREQRFLRLHERFGDLKAIVTGQCRGLLHSLQVS